MNAETNAETNAATVAGANAEADAGPCTGSNAGPMRLRPASAALADYLAADEVIDHGHPEIRALADRLRGVRPEAGARAAFEYVRDEIAHSGDVGEWSAAYRASDVLANRNAICHGKAHLLTALLRALTRARPGAAGYDYLPSEL
ncbi:transglutaminase domain-containing protein [Kitasatospora sp. HPMI-4]|uniref:transglutaminase domain-containing protein n=1 Tax=Kitasatospora sp. HPMI-4 TaxID=3448443 RepID=UPI003F1B9D9E